MSKDNELMLDVGQANELKLAFRRNGWTNADVKNLCDGDKLAKILHVLRGHSWVGFDQDLIDLDADPFVPGTWKVKKHQKGGQLVWSPEKVKLYLSSHQKGEKYIEGNKLRKELECERVMNANLLDYLLKHQELIPEEWKGQTVFFWGTIYRDLYDNLYVRGLYFDDGRWYWRYGWLDYDWSVSGPAVVAS